MNSGGRPADFFVRTLRVKDKVVIDSNCNLKVNSIKNNGPMTQKGPLTVCGPLNVDCIESKTTNGPITVKANVITNEDLGVCGTLNVDCLDSKTTNGPITVKANVIANEDLGVCGVLNVNSMDSKPPGGVLVMRANLVVNNDLVVLNAGSTFVVNATTQVQNAISGTIINNTDVAIHTAANVFTVTSPIINLNGDVNVSGNVTVEGPEKFIGNLRGQICDVNGELIIDTRQGAIPSVTANSATSNVSSTINLILNVLRQHNLIASV